MSIVELELNSYNDKDLDKLVFFDFFHDINLLQIKTLDYLECKKLNKIVCLVEDLNLLNLLKPKYSIKEIKETDNKEFKEFKEFKVHLMPTSKITSDIILKRIKENKFEFETQDEHIKNCKKYITEYPEMLNCL